MNFIATSLLCPLVLLVMIMTAASRPNNWASSQFLYQSARQIVRCSDTKFRCSLTNECIPGNRYCDGYPDCPSDGNGISADEASCICARDEFQCLNNMCIKNSSRCNGYQDCPYGTDELHCECPQDKRLCVEDGFCISSNWVCDNRYDCEDKSDEQDCSKASRNYFKAMLQESKTSGRQLSFNRVLSDYHRVSSIIKLLEAIEAFRRYSGARVNHASFIMED